MDVFAGAIFDWDGVILDSSACHAESWERLARENSRTLPEGHFKAGFGRKNEFIIPNILGWTHDAAEVARLSLRKEALYREVVRERGVEPLPGVREWLAALADAGVPCAVGSSSHRENIDLVLDVLGLGGRFAGIVAAHDVGHGKPHPEVFLKAAASIGRAPSQCVVFEDAHVGIEAALAGGMKCVALTTTHPRETLGGAHLVVDSFVGLRVADVAALFA